MATITRMPKYDQYPAGYDCSRDENYPAGRWEIRLDAGEGEYPTVIQGFPTRAAAELYARQQRIRLSDPDGPTGDRFEDARH
jgi:hypothetical protein